MSTTTESRTMEIARTILNQIKALDYWALGAYGATNYACISESNEFAGGVEFKVNGLNHKGWIKIKLTWDDVYQISFIGKDRNLVKVVDGVYCDKLVDVLDFIEGK